MKFFDAAASHPMAVRLFVLERGGLNFDVETIDIMSLQNRRLAFRAINPRGEVPALRLDNGTVLTEITAICEYLDEIALGGTSLFGNTPEQRAETRMWLRRIDLEVCQPINSWFRNDPATVDFYKGNRLPTPDARVNQKVLINQALNMLDDQLEGKTWLCGDRFSAADIHFYGLMKMMAMQVCDWMLLPGRENFLAYWKRLDEREASKKALQNFPLKVVV
ncbi:Putative Glutathione S-transferase domain-containing protein [Penicillium brasilianum]|uniref:Putative Glutathione S-transferase domain-containing protein n=1 Tax=Penicillium brasilianum TaxID=104259 RepID=A0A0F7TQK6_PENBI|nr:Putative Glutathione S-transferase domain-containing protein [Penicillium brasilianum]